MIPTHRVTSGRTRRRRAHQALKAKTSTTCPLSGQTKQHHRACAESGFVRPGLVISVPKLGIGPKRD
ncbi:MAG TPA: 50S ribosomal protein L32 [Phycisphaerales bacterium]|nr:50S ribosomal protein L32 [Phycisphaerales bacterium]